MNTKQAIPRSSWLTVVAFAAAVGFVTGCSSARVDTMYPSPSFVRTVKAPVPPTDESWGTDSYLRAGMPDPGRLWLGRDYADCRDVLNRLDITNRAALPRMESPRSGAIFARLINGTNTLSLGERFLPTSERIRLFIAILNRLPAFQDIYHQSTREPVLHREAIEIHHTYLSLLRSAVEWDGKALPPALGETQGATFRLTEISPTYTELMLKSAPEQSIVPRGDRFITIGAHTAVTLGSIFPWLADGSGMPEDERRRAIRYVTEEVPVLWPHVKSAQQRELVSLLDSVLRRISSEDIRRDLEVLRSLLRN